jgi:hypothetical protein
MTDDLPAQRPEGEILKKAQRASGQSIRQVATSAGMSDARWRQIVNGYMHVSGVNAEVVAPPKTLARMAHVVGVTPEQLVSAGREDAADALEDLQREAQNADVQGTSAPVPAVAKEAAGVMDEIELIYGSSMTAVQKLEAIRKVLILRAEAEKERRSRRSKAESPKAHGTA